MAERIAIALSQPGVIARSALAARRYGDHPYAITLPDPEFVGAVDGGALRDLHRSRVLPAGSTLVLVGDLDPAVAADVVDGALGSGSGPGTPSRRRRPRISGAPASRWWTGPVRCSPTSGSVDPRPAGPIPTCPPCAWPT
ncbi:hypothetical protein [Blastococcus brunescens]|uniref:CobW C-terminal domain-containing protein n=1 Tax=Blastococcus brunescens TaxID=1564165 RepID=A0ABZ1AZ82_9ACTN|nr:hypothetical protein [Blastococcus sp. BMG 8361]WRL62791.1 hypothetical protein U6N30_23280 [Blastococcus sp. BMG 8361]